MHPDFNDRTDVNRPLSQVTPGIMGYLSREIAAASAKQNEAAPSEDALARHSIQSTLHFHSAMSDLY